ncbi:MAG: sigma-70 family RNA polymerase sigma factor, partial [Eubacteriales bacterium]|nr:sigma-70 family RNA polymerase sigma factor [Eubacteriales bacterium]
NEILMHFRNNKKNSLDISLNESIDTDKDGNPLTLMDIMSVEDDILEKINTKMNLDKLYSYMDEVLSDREKEILILRFGLKDTSVLTQREIAKKLNISRSYVSRIEKKALLLLKKRFEKP